MAKTLKSGEAGLISINKPHTDNIFSFIKRFEWRKQPLPLGKYYVYETKRNGGCGKVIGEFRVCESTRYRTKNRLDLKFIPSVVIELGCVDVETLYKYGGGEPIYANLLNGITRYDEPKELGEFFKPCYRRINCERCDKAIFKYCAKRFDAFGNQQFYAIDGKPKWDVKVVGCSNVITRPPQSWCRVKEIKI